MLPSPPLSPAPHPHRGQIRPMKKQGHFGLGGRLTTWIPSIQKSTEGICPRDFREISPFLSPGPSTVLLLPTVLSRRRPPSLKRTPSTHGVNAQFPQKLSSPVDVTHTRLEAKSEAVQTMIPSSWKDQSTDPLSGQLKISLTHHDATQQTGDAEPRAVQTRTYSGEETPAVGPRSPNTLDFDIGKFSGLFGKRSSSLASVSTLTHELQPDSDRNHQKEVHGSVADINGLCSILRSSKENERVLCLEQRLREAHYELESQDLTHQKIVRKLEYDLKQRSINLVWLTNERQKLTKDLEETRKEISRALSEQTNKYNALEEQLQETKRQCEIQLLRAKSAALHIDEPKQVTTECMDVDELKSWYASEMEELKDTIQKLEAVEEELEALRRASDSKIDNLRQIHAEELTAAQEVAKRAQAEKRAIYAAAVAGFNLASVAHRIGLMGTGRLSGMDSTQIQLVIKKHTRGSIAVLVWNIDPL
ncbi:unnamed protein product [Schistocephalus solidus]|uniref:Kinesin-like protein n=1 Tax=Schistocephalus solidus TaxID=70667 RepID=A0A183SFI1_SCHSO|nr:unnamed protein product [Schistocephalus solidus]